MIRWLGRDMPSLTQFDVSGSVRDPPTMRPRQLAALSGAATCLLGLAVLDLLPPGADLPAQVYRALLADHGVALWDAHWYGGHYLPGYSVIAPTLAAVIGPRLLALAAAAASSALFAALVAPRFGARAHLAIAWFAAAVLADVVVGRTAFALGQAFALASALALARDYRRTALGLAVLAGAASPVAGVLWALAASALWHARRARCALGVAAAAVSPVLVTRVLFPEGGVQPFGIGALGAVLGLTALLWSGLRRSEHVLRVGSVFYAGACTIAFLIPSPLGANVLRLGMLFGAPLLLAAGRPRARVLALPLVALAVWQTVPAVRAASNAAGDPSLKPAYWRPLLEFLARPGTIPGRLEIPMTLNHWESAFVAPRVPLARGWERQLDIERNPVFYSGRLTASSYRSWLRTASVRYVALPDVPLDRASLGEARLLRRRQPYLVPVFRSRHWRVWRVRGAPPLASAGFRMASHEPGGFTVIAPSSGTTVIRLRYTPLWTVIAGAGCVTRAPGGFTGVTARRAGPLRVAARLELVLEDRDTRCRPSRGR